MYLVSFASFVLGTPERVSALGSLTDTGVDARASIVLRGPRDGLAHLYTTLEARTPTAASITGTRGTLEIGAPFYLPSRLTLREHGRDDGADAVFAQRSPEDGLCFEAAEVARSIAAGRTESPLVPLAETVQIARTVDAVRANLSL